ncbi:N-6 DNA methylase [Dactylosporangium sp. AC04546]|uniref:N-6 DNA methylase n=1 Tax=Dactylosporangium sp. AC04546 TaxID=2862460 RepID=UPI001EE005E2|nr:N-6 DNA methylase [Dactylosporangium sp. AC04546]WVK82719.1 N-6 DNA methylase [Dactylosporangium sp. AC04546]
MQEEPTITAAEIARLAGVGRAAVSNWRKRHTDFPAPVGGTPASPEFDMAEIERWLHRQGKVPELSAVDKLWRHIVAAGDNPAATLASVAAILVAHQRNEWPTARRIDPNVRHLLPEIDKLADESGARTAFDELWRRFSEPSPGRPRATPDDLADLMVALAEVAGGAVLDPAAGSGGTLRAAARAGCTSAYGQELDEPLARLATLWLNLCGMPGEVMTGDSLRADAFAERSFDAVVCHPPFGVTNWGQEELGYDPRWAYGAPPRTEPELAWVQHALAHLRPGGRAVLLMPPSAASRRAGRRIRAELLRRGALRAVVALPGGAAAPHAVPLHLWLLQRPVPDTPAPARTLLIDATAGNQQDSYARVVALTCNLTTTPDAVVDEPGFARAVPVIDLLDEEVDLTPARRQPAGGEQTGERLVRTRERLAAVVTELPSLMPRMATTSEGGTATPTVSVAELARTGALQLIGPIRAAGADDDASGVGDGPAVLSVQDVLQGHAASGRDASRLGQEIRLAPGDVVVPMIARQLTARVVNGDGPLLGRNLYLLRPNPAALDPWFLAGQLRTSGNEKQASSLAGALRFDIRRAQIRRLPLAEQRAHGAAFRRLVAFESALREAAALGAELVQLTADGLAGGVIQPDDPTVR